MPNYHIQAIRKRVINSLRCYVVTCVTCILILFSHIRLLAGKVGIHDNNVTGSFSAKKKPPYTGASVFVSTLFPVYGGVTLRAEMLR